MMSKLDLPCIATKKELFNHFNKINPTELRTEITEIVSHIRQIPVNKAKVVKVLKRNEVVLLMGRLGDSLTNLDANDLNLIKSFES